MIRSRLDLPEPLGPRTPILAPGRKASVTSLRTCLSGGCNRLSRYIVKMYWVDIGDQPRGRPKADRLRASDEARLSQVDGLDDRPGTPVVRRSAARARR